MSWALSGPRLSFQAKVLIPVLTIMVVLLVLPTWIFSRRMSYQLESAGAENLRRADAVFNNLQSIRAKGHLLRYRNVPHEPRFRAVAQLSDAKTLRFLLQELMEDFVCDVIQFTDDQERPVARLGRGPQIDLEQFSSRSTQSVRLALAGEPNTETTSVGARLFDVASVPVLVRDNVVGALTFATEIGQTVAQEFKQLTRSDIVLLAQEHIATATIFRKTLAEELAEPLREFSTNGFSADRRAARVSKIVLNGEHFMCLIGRLSRPEGDPTLGYVLLSSYESPLQAMKATQHTFLGICVVGILFSTTLVWLLLRRITNPLRELRDSAEAVGRGDFSQRVKVTSRDECGELAAVFNQMTANLEASREQLEKTFETLKNTQAQLIQSEKLSAIGTLAGGIAHDFNNILGAIIGFTELLSDDLPAGNRVGNNLREVLKAGHRAKALVRQILAFSRQSEPQRVRFQLEPVMEEALGLLRATLPATVQIRTRFVATVDTVVADPTQMHQVLMNLGTNACHAMRDDGGILTVGLEEFEVPLAGCSETPQLKPGHYLRCTVEDTGSGMEPSVLERIFEPFYTTKPVGEGTGLGLSVVHGIVKAHGGEITVASRPGEGTTFHIYLPRAEDSSPCCAVPEPRASGGSERILLVDDEEPLVNMMQQRLSRLGYVVVAHQDSVEAWKAFQSAPESFDLVITDQTMPRLSGADLANRIVRLKSGIPVILCSGSGASQGRTEAFRPAVRECILKPVDFVDLSRMIRRVLKEP